MPKSKRSEAELDQLVEDVKEAVVLIEGLGNADFAALDQSTIAAKATIKKIADSDDIVQN